MITHCLVNLPMLYGPLAPLCYLNTVQGLWGAVPQLELGLGLTRGTLGKEKTHAASDVVAMDIPPSALYPAYRGIIITGLIVLSCAPHQEPIFLLALSVPLTLLHRDGPRRGLLQQRPRRRAALLLFWIVFNYTAALFFGVLHQGGVVPYLLALAGGHGDLATMTAVGSGTPPRAIVVHHTYIPLTFLLRDAGAIGGSGGGDGGSSAPEHTRGGDGRVSATT